MARAATGSRRVWLGRAGLVLGSTVAMLLVAEVALRLLGVAPSRYAQPRHLETGDKRHGIDAYADDPRGYFPLDLGDVATRARLSALGFTDLERYAERTPHAIASDYTETLCRGARVPPRRDGTRRVLVVGDSFTEGQGVRDEDTFAAVLARDTSGMQVINCGRRGYDFPELGRWIREHLDVDPDVVVYAMTLNDFEQSEAFHARQTYVDDWILDRRRTVSEGDGSPPTFTPRLFAMIDDRLEGARVGAATTRWYQEMVGPANRDGFETTIEEIVRLEQASREQGAAFLVVLWPLLVALDGDYPFASVHQTIEAALSAHHVAFRDALPAFLGEDPERLWVHATDRHPNEIAHAMFAHVVAEALEADGEP